MLKKIVAATVAAGALGLIAGPAMAEDTACVDAYLEINGTAQTIHQCV